jgi:hypothetical protein
MSVPDGTIGQQFDDLVESLRGFRACAAEPPSTLTISWMEVMRGLGVSEKAIPLLLAAAQAVAYGDEG